MSNNAVPSAVEQSGDGGNPGNPSRRGWETVFKHGIAAFIFDKHCRAYFLEPPHDVDVSQIRATLCRMGSHAPGIVFYSNGYEPDYSCQGCGDNLG
jgi:hypothetical protein